MAKGDVAAAVAYVRVSTDRQAKEGVSLEAQEAGARAWATARGFALLGVHADAGVSGKRTDNRPALAAALDSVCHARATLVVYSLARLARSVKDTVTIAERLDRAGANLVSLSENIDTTGAAGKMVFRLLAVLAEFERDLISERTAAALAHKRSRGERTGGDVPFGYRSEGKALAADPREQEVIALMRQLRAGGLGLRRVATRLNELGHRQKRGGAWSHVAVDRTLRTDARLRAARQGVPVD
jgi:DNA invertase Pin-like site-specific DNA recombinase